MNELRRKIMTKLVRLRAKTYSYLTDYGKFENENYKNCLEATQLDNKIRYLDKNEINIDSLENNHKKLMRHNKPILKTQQRFKSEKHNIFSEEALSSNDDKRMQ